MALTSSFLKKKYNFDHILINGCSHSAGSEIEGSGIGEGNYNREHCFGALLSKRLGVPYTNIALPGASNDYINRTTCMWILDNPTLIKKTLFLINWTGSNRSEIFFNEYTGSTYWHFIPHVSDKSVGHIHTDHYAPMFPEEMHRNLTVLSKYMFVNEEHWEINRYLNIINLQTILKSNNLNYIFKNGFQWCAAGERYNYYRDKIDNKKFIGFDNEEHSFFEHCLNEGFSIAGQQYYHHRQAAHEYWANRLYHENFL